MNASRLLSDLWVKVSGKLASDFDWVSGAYFFSTMALVMQHLLIDHARRTKCKPAESLDGLLETQRAPNTAMPATYPQNRNWFQEKADQSLCLQ